MIYEYTLRIGPSCPEVWKADFHKTNATVGPM